MRTPIEYSKTRVTRNAIERAVELVGVTKLAQACGLRTHQSVSRWKREGIVPANYVLQVEKATDYQVPRYELRPDIYPADEEREYLISALKRLRFELDSLRGEVDSLRGIVDNRQRER